METVVSHSSQATSCNKIFTTYFRIEGIIHSVNTYEKNNTKFYEITTLPEHEVSCENKIVPPGYHKSRYFFSADGLINQWKLLDWSFVEDPNQIWILGRFDTMRMCNVLLSRAIEIVDTDEFMSKWHSLTKCQKNECILSSGFGVLLEFVIHDPEITDKTKDLIQKEKSGQFEPCSCIKDLDASEYYFNGEIHKIGCWRHDCYESDCYCFEK